MPNIDTSLTSEFDIQVLETEKLGILRYANSTSYRKESTIRKEVTISWPVVEEFKRIVADAEIVKYVKQSQRIVAQITICHARTNNRESDEKWPERNRDGKQELEVRLGQYHIAFETAVIGSMSDVQKCEDPEGLRVFYYLCQDLKAFVLSLMSLHFKIKPI